MTKSPIGILHVILMSLFLAPFPLLGKVDTSEIYGKLETMPKIHPRLFLEKGGEARIRQMVSSDTLAARIYEGVLYEAKAQLTSAPVERRLTGKRLLGVSRMALSRVLHLALAWRITGDDRFLDRAQKELLAVAEFTDWNPKHFLDVAEMTLAVAVGYDWLYPNLDEKTRGKLRTAIIEKGLKASLKANSWARSTNNWNQVCNGGLTAGALAVAESEPRLAAEIIARAVNTVPLSMHEYMPDGAYPEGPGYWDYGTTFNVILISALQSTLGTDFGLSKSPGFMSTADYYIHVVGPTGVYFNYSDCGHGGKGITPAMFWFANHRNEPNLLWAEWNRLHAKGSSRAKRNTDRTTPLALVWMPNKSEKPSQPTALSWTGNGKTPVAFHRNAWTDQAVFLGIKGGSPSANHAHMDVGSFIMEADGERWADDLGAQDYNSLESKGVDLWKMGQTSPRWSVFRIGTSSHNVLMVDGKPQCVPGNAPIITVRSGKTVIDTTQIYKDQLANAKRGAALMHDGSVVIQDEITALDKPSTIVRWAMLSAADVSIDSPGKATLTKNGKKLSLQVLQPAGAALKIISTAPPTPVDTPNPGTRIIGFEVSIRAKQQQQIVVRLIPQSSSCEPISALPLAKW